METQESFNSGFIADSYTVLEETLKEFLENTEDLFSSYASNNNYLNSLLMKIDLVKDRYELDNDEKDEVASLEASINSAVLDAFMKEFRINPEVISEYLESSTGSTRFVIETIYNNLYLKRRQNIIDFLVNYTFNNKSQFVKKFKKPDSKKDITYQSIRNSLQLSNPDYYILVMNYREIANDILSSVDNISIQDFLDNIDLEPEEHEVLSKLFDSSENNYSILTDDLLSSSYLIQVLFDYKDAFINAIKNAL